jgi:hypothetical protein
MDVKSSVTNVSLLSAIVEKIDKDQSVFLFLLLLFEYTR